MKNKIVSATEAIAIIRNGDTVACSGFVGSGTPDELINALEKRFTETASPRDLTLLFAAAPGDGKDRGLNRLAHDGLVKRAVGGHWGLVPKLSAMAVEGRIEAYNLPLGTLSQLFRDIAGHRAGTLTKVGLRTFVDPRQQGGKINDRTTDDLVRVMQIDDEEWLFYKAFPVSVALLRGTTADLGGNITMEREALTLDNLALAMAAKNSNGFVIVQVERVCAHGMLNPRQVQIPGVLVDCVVLAQSDNHRQTYATMYNPAFSGELKVPLDMLGPMPLDERKIIARRCAFELPMGGVVNLGIGMPEGVAQVANEEKVLNYVTLTAEPGVIGGLPQSGLDFGAAVNTDAVIHQNQQFDFYDGGGLDMACLGMAQVDADGHVNVSRFGPRLAGAGGFINISQSSRRVLFAGTFTTGGLEVKVENGELKILREGKSKKFIRQVEQITFNGAYAAESGQPVLYVTERCVFRRGRDGMELIEVAPGIDINRDILGQMEFTPIVRNPGLMDPRIFRDQPMELEETLLGIGIAERVSYDAERNTLFLNLEGLHVRNRDDVDRVRRVVEERCQTIGKKVALVVNYDNFLIDAAVSDTYAAMVRYMETHYYTTASRYTTSAFLRLKLGEALARRRVAPHIFETSDEANSFVQGDAEKDPAVPLDPQVQAVLDKLRDAGNPEYWQMSPQRARDWHNRKAGILDVKPEPVFKTSDRSIPGPAGSIPVRIFVPRQAREPLPVLVWLHGGGHVVGSLDSYDALCRQLALQGDCLVVSVAYRLAPEHKFPAGVEDSFAALQWAAEHAAEIGGDPQRLAIGGDSAGGNLAAVCAILARDAGSPRLALQLLVYPRTAPDEEFPSHHEYAEGHLLTRKTILWFHQHYRASDGDREDFRYAPLICTDLTRLPPALIIVGECDPLRDDGIEYAERLRREGNVVELTNYPGMVHPFFSMGGAVDAGRRALTQAATALRREFERH